jgi:enoyl-CoA hydratase
VLVISSTGKHFSAGMALETFGSDIALDDQSPEGRAAIFDMLGDMQATFTKLETLRIPVIAAIQGGCIGGAVDMVTACCLRYATADAFFCIQEINIGMVADVGTLQRLPKLVPLAVVKELAYTGRRLPAAKALGYGLVNEVFESAKPCWRPRCGAPPKSPPSRRWRSGAPSRPSTTRATIRWTMRSSRWAGCRARSGATRMCASP